LLERQCALISVRANSHQALMQYFWKPVLLCSETSCVSKSQGVKLNSDPLNQKEQREKNSSRSLFGKCKKGAYLYTSLSTLIPVL